MAGNYLTSRIALRLEDVNVRMFILHTMFIPNNRKCSFEIHLRVNFGSFVRILVL